MKSCDNCWYRANGRYAPVCRHAAFAFEDVTAGTKAHMPLDDAMAICGSEDFRYHQDIDLGEPLVDKTRGKTYYF